jgi:hypothetical protein
MRIEAVINELAGLFPQCEVGKTARPGSSARYFERAENLDFQRMPGPYHLYSATNDRGTTYYLGVDLRTRKISCGTKPGKQFV